MSTVERIDALTGRGSSLEPGMGLEPSSRAARLILFQELNDEIDKVNERWSSADLAAQALGLDTGVGQVDVPHVADSNFYEGPLRSLIEAPPEKFPNVTVMAYMTMPAARQFADQVDSSTITMFVESMQISGPVPDGLDLEHEVIVHRRIQRMTEAVAAVIARNPTLLGTVHDLRTPAQGGVGNSSWLRRADNGAGPRYIWHGSRLQFTLTRHHATF